MKKYILTLLSISMLFIPGCSNDSDISSNPVQPQSEQSETERIKHEISDKVDTSGYSKLNEFSYDFDSDGEEDLLELFSTVFYKEDEKPILEDGANWLITVTTKNGVYKIFDGFIKPGYPILDIGELYNEQPQKVIILTQNVSTAGKSVTHYTFSDGVFYEELVYSTDNFTEDGANIVQTIN